MCTPRLLTTGCCTGTPTSSTDVQRVQSPWEALLQLWPGSFGCTVYQASLYGQVPRSPVLVDCRVCTGVSWAEERQTASSQAAPQTGQGMNKTWGLGNPCSSSTCRNKHLSQWVQDHPSQGKKKLEIHFRQQKSTDTCFHLSPELSPAAPLAGEAHMPWEQGMINWNNFA